MVKMNYSKYGTLLQELGKVFSATACDQHLCLAIDGGGGAGKSTLAENIAALDARVKIVHVDDLYLPSSDRHSRTTAEVAVGGNYDLDKLLYEVIYPYRNGTLARYQKYDWLADRFGDWDEVSNGQILLIEGVYSLHRKLRNNFDVKIWLDCPRDERLRRGIERDGEALRDFWEKEWLPLEDEYFRMAKPWQYADYVLDGTKSG